MFHCLAWSESVAQNVENDLQPVPDTIIAINNNHFFPTRDYDLVAANVHSVTIARARFVSPSLRQVTNPYVRPIHGAVTPGDDVLLMDLRQNPLKIRGLEELQLNATQVGAGAERVTGIAMISDSRIVQPPQGDIFKLRYTSTTAAVANVWSLLVLTFDDVLPRGRYHVVGNVTQGAVAQAARLIFEEQNLRPGGLSVAALNNRTDKMQENGGLGVWGTFDSNRMPQVEVLANAATAVWEGYMDIIRIG